MKTKNIFTELKRRNVYRAAVAYGVVAWFLTQLTTQVFPFFEIPNSAVRFVVIVLAIGFPIAMLLSWIYELTPEGVVRTEDLDPVEARSVQRKSGRLLDFIIIGALLLVIAMLVVGRFPFYGQTSESISQKSIAVLPFENLSPDPDNAYFATGIQDEILTRIAKIGALKVISRVSTRQYPARPDNLSEIAHQLGVANILEGSVQRAADQVHVNVQLISAATDEHLWAESYDRKLENIFGVEAEVATAVAEALKAKLTGAEQHALEQKPTNNPEAYDPYLRGIALYGETNSADEAKAIQAFEEAVALDPNFTRAWAMLARLNSDSYSTGAKPSGRAEAQKALENAVRLQPNLPEVQLAQATYEALVLRDYEHARPIFERLLTELPNDADVPSFLALISLRQGRWPESRAYVEKGIELNPRERVLRLQAAYVRETTRDFPAALNCYDEALSIWPDESAFIALKAAVYQSLGELDRADALLKELHITAKNDYAGLDVIYDQAKLRRSYSDTIGFLRSFLDQAGSLPAVERDRYLERLADLQRLSGDVANAKKNYVQARNELEQRLKEQPDDDGILASLAKVSAGLGDSQLAMKYIESAISLMPASKDAWGGPEHEEQRARIAARFGMKNIAIPALEHLLKTSYWSPLTPALLRLDPDFDSVRSDPRFQKLLSESEPK